MLQAIDALPLNIGLTGKGNTSRARGPRRADRAGALRPQAPRGLGHHAGRDRLLPRRSPSEHDVQVTIHTDTLNESGYVDDSIAAFKGRTIHTYHTEGAGGGHAPDIIRVCGEPNVLPSSTNPTRPFTVNTLDEHLDMLMVCHHLDREDPRGRRVRREPDPRRDDRGRGHPPRPRRDQHDVERQPGDGPDRRGHHAHLADRAQDEAAARRARRRRAATTTSGSGATSRSTRSTRRSRTASSHDVGSVEVGKLADLVLWQPAFFGAKPAAGAQGRLHRVGADGRRERLDPDAAAGAACGRCSARSAAPPARHRLAFVSRAARRRRRSARARPRASAVVAVRDCRGLGKRDMKLNDALPQIEVDPETYEVRADGVAADLRAGDARCRSPSATSCSDARSVALAARRLGVSRPAASRTRPGSRRCARSAAARRGRAGAAPRRARLAHGVRGRCRSSPRRTPATRPPPTARCDRVHQQPRRQPREPRAGPRVLLAIAATLDVRSDRRCALAARARAARAAAVRRICRSRSAPRWPRRVALADARELVMYTHAALGGCRRRSGSASSARCARQRLLLGRRARRAPARSPTPPASAQPTRARRRRWSSSPRPRTTGSTRGCSSRAARNRMPRCQSRRSRWPRDHDHGDGATHDHTPRAPGEHAGARFARSASTSARARRDFTRARVHRRHRRPGRQRQDRARARAVPRAARSPLARRRDQRHLHARGRRVPDPPRGAAARADPRGRDRRLPARRDPRGHHARTCSRSRT